MIFTDYYKAENLKTESKTRYDITSSTDSYHLFEILNNKRGFNKNGKSLNYGKIPERWNFKSEKRKPEKALTKNSSNISSVFFPDIAIPIAYGDINHTNDGLIIVFDYPANSFEIFIARGQANFMDSIYEMVRENMLDEEIKQFRENAIIHKIDS